MKKFLLGTVALGAGASAADLAPRYTKAPAMINPAYNWTGFYVGLNAGAASTDGGLAAVATDVFLKVVSPIGSARLDFSAVARLATTTSRECRCLASKPMPLGWTSNHP
jgi:opacity protein-like surface antigen